jgi:serine/threonine protein kinase
MNPDAPTPQPAATPPPVSTLGGPVAELIAQRMVAPPLRPGLLGTLNQFEIQRVLGSGGMGMVLLARDAYTGKSVAVKLIRPELVSVPQVVHRFVKEAGHLQKLKHPNIVPVLEVSDRPAGPYFVMPYYERGSLAQAIQPGQPLEIETTLDIALDVAAGLQFAHRRGIIHRDLKPANILRPEGQPACLADFGLARTVFNDTIVDVEHQRVEGTAPYMSPGVAAGDAEDTRCDIYAFGALLYEMLTGEPPYAGRSLEDIRRQILAGPPRPIRERNPGADHGLCLVAEGAMARELRDRYADMADVLADLQRIKDGRTPVGPRGLVHGGLRRVFEVPAAAFVAVLLLAAFGSWIYFHFQNQPGRPKPLPPVLASNLPNLVAVTSTVADPTPPPPATNRNLPGNPIPVPAKPAPPSPWKAVVFAGHPGESGSQDGPATDARFKSPGGLAADTAGNLYVADTGNNTIRKISPSGDVTTFAGKPGAPGALDNRAGEARFRAPIGIAVDRRGTVYVTELANCAVRRITGEGWVGTLAGVAGNHGTDDGVGDNAHFSTPWSVASDPGGLLFVADTSSCTIRKITTNGVVTTFAGLAGGYGYADGVGNQARFWNPHGVALDKAGNVFVADTGNHLVRRISPDGSVTVLAGRPGSPGFADGP